MVGNNSYRLNDANAQGNRIQALLTNGFEIGTHNDVNRDDRDYHYIAWAVTADFIQVGSYMGNGLDNRSIAGIGFEPEYVMMKTSDQTATHKTASTGVATDTTLKFVSVGNVTNSIQALEADGFQVGTRDDANDNGADYFWIAFRGL